MFTPTGTRRTSNTAATGRQEHDPGRARQRRPLPAVSERVVGRPVAQRTGRCAVRVPGLFRGAKETSDSESDRPILPDRSAKVRLRISVGVKIGEDDMIVEVPTIVQRIEESDDESPSAAILIEPPEIDFLPEPIDLTIEHTLLWPAGGGQLELPVRIVEINGPRWKLFASGPTRRLQRREYVRVDLHVAAVVKLVGEEGEIVSAFSGVLLDLCEGGTRCLPRGEPPTVGTRVLVEFEGEKKQLLQCPGIIVRHVPAGKRAFSQTALAIRFDDPEQHGDSVRRMVFAQQLRIRQVR
ncbi:MAG: PilZ protein [Actinomycetota bacterium]|nr:PilZ protein [Actinomycetota bacterium]